MFYGYDQGVMSQVNLNPDYQMKMGIYPVMGTYSVDIFPNEKLILDQEILGILQPKEELSPSTTEAHSLVP